MGKSVLTAAVIMAVLALSGATCSAQEKKQVEKKITIVTVDKEGVTKDTTIIESDTLVFESGNLIIDTREGRKIIRRPGEGSRMMWTTIDEDFTGPAPVPGIRSGEMRIIRQDREQMEGIVYRISVDGVTVNITAPKEKSKEADQILEQVKKILMTK